jgi:hypothetical protein
LDSVLIVRLMSRIQKPSLPLAGGLALLQAYAWTALCIIINKLDAGTFKDASDLIQC